MARQYEGYPSWNSWNVSLWINNDFILYSCARDTVWRYGMDKAIDMLTIHWKYKRTQDGGVFNRRSIKLALEGMDE